MPARSDVFFISAGPQGGTDVACCIAATSVMDYIQYFSRNGKFDPACFAGKWSSESLKISWSVCDCTSEFLSDLIATSRATDMLPYLT